MTGGSTDPDLPSLSLRRSKALPVMNRTKPLFHLEIETNGDPQQLSHQAPADGWPAAARDDSQCIYGVIHATLRFYIKQGPSYLRAARQLLS